MRVDAIVDYKEFLEYRRNFEEETVSDLFLPNPSSSLRIPINTAASTVFSFFWARTFRKLYSTSSSFPYKMLGLTACYALTYNVAKEFGQGYLKNNFGFDNIGLPHVFAGALCLSLFLPVHMKAVLELPNFYFKYSLNFFVLNLYWDLGAFGFKKYMMSRQPGGESIFN